MKLSEAQVKGLQWFSGDGVVHRPTAATVRSLRSRGLVAFNIVLWIDVITDAGRAALAQAEEEGQPDNQ